MLRRIVVAAAALLAGGAVAASVLAYAGREPAVQVYVAARDLPAGAQISTDSVRLARADLGPAVRHVYTTGSERELLQSRAARQLAAGELLQRGDLAPAAAGGPPAERRLVVVPVKDAPPLAPGDRVDLLLVGGSADHLSVGPFARGVEVRGVLPSGLVLVVSARQAPAFVYAGVAGRLVAVAAAGPGSAAELSPVGSLEQAIAIAGGQP
jgi:Flp pilus assembly protein CpaB